MGLNLLNQVVRPMSSSRRSFDRVSAFQAGGLAIALAVAGGCVVPNGLWAEEPGIEEAVLEAAEVLEGTEVQKILEEIPKQLPVVPEGPGEGLAAAAPEPEVAPEKVEVVLGPMRIEDSPGILPSQSYPELPGFSAPPLEGDGALLRMDEPLPGEGLELRSETDAGIPPELLRNDAEDLPFEGDEGYEDPLEALLEEEEEAENVIPGAEARNWDAGRYDAGVLESELLPGGFRAPLMREGFRFGVGIFANYDSNIGLAESGEVDDFSMTLTPSVEYRSGPPTGVPGIVTFRYAPYIRTYLQESDFNTVDQSASGSVTYDGTRATFEATADYSSFSESNQFVAGLVDTESYFLGLQGSYQVSDRSLLDMQWSHSFTGYEGTSSGQVENELSSLQVTAQWAARHNLWIGPSLRHAETSSGTIGSSESMSYLVSMGWDPTRMPGMSVSGSAGIEKVDGSLGNSGSSGFTGSLGVNYRSSEKFNIRTALSYATISQQAWSRFAEAGGGGERLTGQLSVDYVPNELWIATGGVSMNSIPSASASGQSTNTTQFKLALIRKLRLARLTLGATLGSTDYGTVLTGAAMREADTTFATYLQYDRDVFAERASFQSTLRWSQNSGEFDWTRMQLSTGLNFEF